MKLKFTLMKENKLLVPIGNSTNNVAELHSKIAELEQIIEQQQLIIDNQIKIIELAERNFGIETKLKEKHKPVVHYPRFF
jgi:hypothetical protein